MTTVELTPDVLATLRKMKDRGTPPPRCHQGPIRSAITGAVRAMVENRLTGRLRPWDLPALQRGVDDGWRLVRFADGADTALRPETTRRVPLRGWGPDAVLAALGIAKPDGVELDVVSADLGQGETETVHRYLWTDGGRTILAEEVKNEICDGATPCTTYVRGVIVDGDRGLLLTGSGDSALIIDG